MIRIVLFLCFLFCYSYSFSQVGIFETHDSFLNKKIDIEYAEYVSAGHAFGSFVIVFKDHKGKKVRIKLNRKKMWGYATENGVYRINKNNNPYRIVESGKIVVYTSYSSTVLGGGDMSLITFDNNQFVPLISDGTNGQLYKMKRKSLKKIFRENPSELKKIKKGRSYQRLFTAIQEYNREAKK